MKYCDDSEYSSCIPRNRLWDTLCIMWLVVVPSIQARTATIAFHDSVLVNDTVFTLGDIATVSGDDPAVVIGLQNTYAGISAPPSYGRFINVQDLMMRIQLHFASVEMTIAGSSRPLVRTDFQEIGIDRFSRELHAYLDSSLGWDKKTWRVEFENLDQSVKVRNAPFTLVINGLEHQQYPKGPTVLTLHLGQGTRDYAVPVHCGITVQCPVIIAAHDIPRGKVLSADDGTVQTVDITRFSPIPFSKIELLEGKRAARTIRCGTVLHDRLLQTVPVIEKNDPVLIMHQSGGLSISVAGTARERGGAGDRIWVENHATHKLIRVMIIAKGKVSPATGDVAL